MTKEEILEFYHKQYETKVRIVSKNAKKKRVLYALICVFVLTLCYEYKSQIIDLFTTNNKTQGLENHISITNSNKQTFDSFKQLKEPFSAIVKENPSFASDGSNLLMNLNKFNASLDTNDKPDKDKAGNLLNSIYLFVSKPQIKQNKRIKDFKQLILNIDKKNDLNVIKQSDISPLVFNRNSKTVKLGIRNLFEYGE